MRIEEIHREEPKQETGHAVSREREGTGKTAAGRACYLSSRWIPKAFSVSLL